MIRFMAVEEVLKALYGGRRQGPYRGDSHVAVFGIKCPYCKAKKGWSCTTGRTHLSRIKAFDQQTHSLSRH